MHESYKKGLDEELSKRIYDYTGDTLKAPIITGEILRAAAKAVAKDIRKPVYKKAPDTIIYMAMYSPCIHESVAGPISLHRSLKTAEQAIVAHKEAEKLEWEERWPSDPNHEDYVEDMAWKDEDGFAGMQWWGIKKQNLLP